MLNLNHFAIAGLLIAVTYFPLSLFIFIKGKTRLSKIYALHIFAVFIWGVVALLIGTTKDANTALSLWQTAGIGPYFAAVFFLHAILIIINKESKLLLFPLYFQAILYSYITITGNLYTSVRLFNESFYLHNGNILFHTVSFSIWIIICTIAHMLLTVHYKNLYPNDKKQLTALFLSITGFIGGAQNFLPGFGIDLNLYGNFLIPLHSITITYAIFKHQFLDIKFALKRSIVYSILIATISIIYLLTVFILENFVRQSFAHQSTTISILTAFCFGFLLFPIKNIIQKIVDKSFFRGTPLEIAKENVLLRAEVAEKEKFKAVATLASGIAHEVKNPLTALKTFIEYFPEKKNDPEFVKKFINVAGKEIDRIDELANGLLDFSKPSSPQLSEFSVNNLINDTLNLLANDIKKANIKVTTNLIADSYKLKADKNQIKQALLNIILNAIEAMPDGGTLNICSTHNAQHCMIIIEDTGKGMTDEQLKHLFEPFYTQKDSGNGLGLAITYGIIENHKGKISVLSAIDKGTQFLIQLGYNHA